MHRFIAFWKKDIINKMIVLAMFFLVAAVVVEVVLLNTTPLGRNTLAQLFPTPTLSFSEIIARSTDAAATSEILQAKNVVPTMTTRPFTPVPPSPTPSPTLPSPTPTVIQPTPTVATPSPTPTKTASIASQLACIPSEPVQTGKVLTILDGNTVKVLIDGVTYTVRYLGIDIPTAENFALLAANKNGDLVFAKEITLVGDGPDKDSLNRLLRYIKVGDTFVNLKLIQDGLASAISPVPALSCDQVFKDAEQSAKAAGKGMWFFTPTVPAP